MGILLLLPLFCVPSVCADDTGNLRAWVKPTEEIDTSSLYKNSLTLDDFSENLWESPRTSDTLSITKYFEEIPCLLAVADNPKNRSLHLSRKFNYEDISGYSEVCFSLLVLGTQDSPVSVKIGFSMWGHELSFSASVLANERYTVFCDLSQYTGEDLMGMSVSVESDTQSDYISSAVISDAVCTKTSHSDIAERFCAFDISAGKITEEGIVLTPENGSVFLKADAFLTPFTWGTDAAAVTFSFRIKGLQGARMSIGISDKSSKATVNYTESASLTLSDATDTYAVSFLSYTPIYSWALSFSEIAAKGDITIELVDIDLFPFGESVRYDSSLGSVSRIRLLNTEEAKTVSVEGSITRDAAIKYIDKKLGLYAIPVWGDAKEILNGEPLAETDISTSFSFKLDASKYPEATVSPLCVAVLADEGAICISNPEYPSPPKLTHKNNTNTNPLILSGESEEDVFLANAGSAVIDVSLNDILLSSSSPDGKLAAWGDTYVFLKNKTVSDLDTSVEFFRRTGISVIFRLTASEEPIITDKNDRTNSAHTHSLDVSQKENALSLCAIINYLSQRYEPQGFICSSELRARSLADSKDMLEILKSRADLMRLVYSVASQHIDGVNIILPLDSSVGITDTDPDTRREVSVISSASALLLSLRGNMPWSYMLRVTDSTPADIQKTAATSASLTWGTSSVIVCASVPDDTDFAEYRNALFEKFPDSWGYFIDTPSPSAVKSETIEPQINPLPWDGPWLGSFSIWDFSGSFSTDTWVCPLDKSKITTQVSVLLSEFSSLSSLRALHLSMKPEGDGVCVAAGSLAQPLNLINCPEIEFTVAAQTDSGEEAEFSIVMGNSDKRYEYPIKLTSGGAYSVLCTVDPDFSPEYFAVISDSESLTLEISSVSARSRTLDDSALSESVLMSAPTQTAEAPAENEYMYTIPALIALAPCIIFVLLSKKTGGGKNSEE